MVPSSSSTRASAGTTSCGRTWIAVSGSKVLQGDDGEPVLALDPNRQREERAEGAIETNAIEHFLLEEPAEQQKEYEAGE